MSRRKKQMQRQAAGRLALENLEPRLLLDATAYVDWQGTMRANGDNMYDLLAIGYFRDNEFCAGVEADAEGNVYMLLQTRGTSGLVQGGYDTSYNGDLDTALIKIDYEGNYAWGTYLGGEKEDFATAITIDPQGNPIVAGYTHSMDFPVVSALQDEMRGMTNGYVAKFNGRTGALEWSTYVGFNCSAHSVAAGPSGDIALLLSSWSGGSTTNGQYFPGYDDGFEPTLAEQAYLAHISSGGGLQSAKFIDNYAYFTYYTDMVMDGGGNVYVSGMTEGWDYDINYFPLLGAFDGTHDDTDEAVVMKFDSGGDPVWASFLGGSSDDGAYGISMTPTGDLIVVGYTSSSDFPGFGPGELTSSTGAFVSKISSGGNLLWSENVGAGNATCVDVSAAGSIFVGGRTHPGFQTYNAFNNDGNVEFTGSAFLSKLTSTGQMVYASYVEGNWSGGHAHGLATDAQGNVFIAGWAAGIYTGGTYKDGHFLAKIAEEPYKWTVMVYSNGDNNLETTSLRNLMQMERVDLETLSDDTVKLFVQMDRHGDFDNTTSIPNINGTQTIFSDTRRGEVIYDGDDDVYSTRLDPVTYIIDEVTSTTEADMGAVNPLLDFVQWAMATAPAEKYVLVLHDHGGGLDGMSYDETPDSKLTVREMAAAFDQLPYIDVLVFDMCLMQMMEVNAELLGEVGYVVAGEEVTYGSALNYDKWLGWLGNHENATAQQLAESIYSTDSNPVLSVVDNSKIPAVTTKLNDFVDYCFASATANDWSLLKQIIPITRHYRKDYFRDLGHFMETVSFNKALFSNPAGFDAAAKAVFNAVDAAVLKNKNASDKDFGLSIYMEDSGVHTFYNPTGYKFNDEAESAGSTWRRFLYRVHNLATPTQVTVDPGNTPTQATQTGAQAGVRQSLEADIASASDIDFYSFAASANQMVNVQVFGQASTDGLDPVVTLYAPNRTTVLAQTAANDDGFVEIAAQSLTQTGTYYVAVSSAGNANPLVPGGGDTTGAYTIGLLVGSAAQVQPNLSTETTTVEIGEAELGYITYMSFEVTNTGGSPLTISDITLSNGSVFACPGNVIHLPLTIEPGGMVDLAVSVEPEAEGPLSDVIHIISDDPDTPDLVVSVTADAVEPRLVITLGTGGASRVSFTDADGTTVSVSAMSMGGTVTFTGSDLTMTGTSSVVIRGDDVALASLDLNAATSGMLMFSASGGDGKGEIGDITGGSIRMMMGRGMTLTGNINLTGSLGMMMWGDIADGASITTAQSAGGLMVMAGSIGENVTFDIADKISTMMVTSFASGSVAATEIGMVMPRSGAFGPDLTARTGKIGMVMANGDITGDWWAADKIGMVMARSGAFTGTARAGTTIGMMMIGSLQGALLSAVNKLDMISVSGDILDSYLLAGYDIGADGQLGGGDDVLGGGDVGSLSAGGTFARSYVGAGVLPSGPLTESLTGAGLNSGFTGTIGSVRFKSIDASAVREFGLYAAQTFRPTLKSSGFFFAGVVG